MIKQFSIAVVMTALLAGCAGTLKVKAISESQEVLDLSWQCIAQPISGGRTQYKVTLIAKGTGDLTGDFDVDNFYLRVPGAPAGHCEDIAEEAFKILEGREECATRGYSFVASSHSATFGATCGGKREGLIRIMGLLMRHAHTFVITTP